MKSRSKLFALNGTLSLIQQLITVICGLILPQMILKAFGSSVNGTMSSITQFLSFITLLQGGVGTVARLAYYKPLAQNDNYKISVAYKTISNFYKKFANIFVIYLLGLSFIYPLLVKTGFDYLYVASLVLILGIASASEYFFGQASQMLLVSAQKNYIFSLTQIICTLLSTLIGIALVNKGASIHLVKIGSAIVYAIRPIVLLFYVQRKYTINQTVKPDKSLLSQRNAALVRHIAFYIHTSTDVMVLTVCTNLLWVSVYSVHKYVISSLSNLVTVVLGNVEAVFGDMVARNEQEIMKKQVPVYDLFSKIISCSCFVTSIILISRFVQLYTKGVSDIDYYQPLFATLLSVSELIYCMGITYQSIYIAAGHIKKTEWIAITEACINLFLSIALVWKFGIIGVVIGTIAAMTFKTIANIYYMKKNVFDMSLCFIIKSYAVNILLGILLITLNWTVFYIEIHSYVQFFLWVVIVFAFTAFSYLIVNIVVFKNEMQEIIAMIKRIILKK
ncbi:polysaccharide biosynthesis protein [[Clostridium] fimetarium]|uniref:Membrane protein involved in the export of O-antigen and teichoic acid n=1 Tax=[Clostridium] fimetarium TaxID=99656 RepID=A0A1I0RNM4_9FIRM|nr:polysaccharide biosynthesis C-terminal domain-containing protein [[Clostridium] fimetarium]SEW42655.1 Membrane protein involved in the export of O-antigen and teichoic acid [[Clostridium] fimetarium]